ncbi:MAG: glycosyltransferase [Thermoanaerobaculia bacterium]
MRILIVSASAGAGHTRAGQALEEAARIRCPEAEVRHVDVLDFTGKSYKRAYVGSFIEMVNRAPALWGYLYSTSDRVKETGTRRKLVQFFDRLEFLTFRKFLNETAPDVLLCTHFLPAQVVVRARQHGKLTTPLGLVVTDFDVHAFWVQPTADRFFVASEELKAILASRGIDEERISVTGIPISPVFGEPHDVPRIRAELGLDPAIQTVLVMSGGQGVGTMKEAVAAVLECAPVQVIAVAGKNAVLEAELKELPVPAGCRLIVCGFVTNIQELMSVSNLAVTKSGGLTTSECLAMGLPMLVREPIPGQEERNCDFLLEAGAGLKAQGLASLRWKLRDLLSRPERLLVMSAAARSVGRPDAAIAIVDQMVAHAADRGGDLEPAPPKKRVVRRR